ncbi:MAG: N-acetylmuramoyl-L-alanine amidase [Lachnospiraceae bacterium]|nr:N-acetylmuramoyl-L-alanine amidase [Lachnospiraceae bacterium]
MSNSELVEYIKISPNKRVPRNHKIDTITIHCMAGQLSVETCGNVFSASSAEESSNYGVGEEGRIAMYVEEKDRSWCSSNWDNDNRAVTIEVASDSYHPYAVSDAAYKSTIKLVADICKRIGIEKLIWSNDKCTRIAHSYGANMTVHRDFANKACPGDYLYNRMGDIAKKVNAILDGKSEDKAKGNKREKKGRAFPYMVKVFTKTNPEHE